MANPRKIVTAAEMDRMTPQERADVVNAGIVRNLDDLDPAFRRRVEDRARELAESLGTDG